MSNPESSTILELEARLRELELKFLGPPSEISVSTNPFAPVSSLAKRIERFQSAQPSSEVTQMEKSSTTKLPSLPLPNFDGTDLESFLKSWER